MTEEQERDQDGGQAVADPSSEPVHGWVHDWVNDHWRSLLEGSPDLIYTVDLDGRITSRNRGAAAGEGEWLVGQSVLELARPDERAQVLALLERVRATGTMETYASRGVGPGGAARYHECRCLPVTHDGIVTSFLIVARDVSENRLAQQALASSERRFRTLIENSADAICLVDAQGRILYANPATKRILDYDNEAIVGTDGWQLIHPDDRESVATGLAQLLGEPGGSVAIGRSRFLHRNGSWRWVETVATNLLEDPSVGAIVANYRDVTVRARLEEQLRQAQKMEAIGLLAGGVAHDFNNLLTVILGFTESALSELPREHRAATDLSHVRRAAENAGELTHKLLAFSRRQILHPVVFDLRDLLRGFGDVLGRIVGEDIAVEIRAPDEALPIRGDQVQLEQVLLNLCTNARQAMPAGGRITISAQRLPAAPSTGGPHCELVVADTGVGMNEATRLRIYEPFFTTRAGGTGLGLSVVFGVVQDHQGSIDVVSEEGAGTTVRIELPLVDIVVEPARLVPRELAPVPGGRETLLLAEDQPLVRDLVTRTLRQLGYTVIAASDGAEALALFKREAPRVALVVLDAIMPGMGGLQAFKQMRALRPDLKAIFVSGYAPEAGDLGDLLGSGQAALLQKPFVPLHLALKIRELLDD